MFLRIWNPRRAAHEQVAFRLLAGHRVTLGPGLEKGSFVVSGGVLPSNTYAPPELGGAYVESPPVWPRVQGQQRVL